MIALGAVALFLTALEIFLLVWFYGARYPQFDKIARAEFAIPGLGTISPQGLCTLPENAEGYEFAMSGYMTDKTPSRIYFIDEGGKQKHVTVVKDGKANTSHFGGITCTENYLLVTSGKSVLRIPLAAALAAQDGSAVEAVDAFTTDINNAYIYYYDHTVYVGEFYRPGNYETQKTHHRAVMGGTNYAYIYAFAADESKEGGIVSATPQKVLSVREQVQGVAVYEGGITLSTSYGLPDSRIFTYRNELAAESTQMVTVGGAEVPLYVLDESNLKGELVTPCMSEEICVKDGRLYVLFESMCNKYKYFTRTRISDVCSIELSALAR